jgi:dipeptidyl aminopeptidase/acylaminoacyl peptidase
MRRALFPLGLVLLWSAPAPAQTRVAVEGPAAVASGPAALEASARARALVIEDYYRMKNVGSPRISPDGQWVTYTVSTPVEETNGNVTESWLVRADGSAQPVRIQHEGQNVSNPAWADDGRLRYTHENASWLIDPARPGTAPARAPGGAAPAGGRGGRGGGEQEGVRSPDGQWIARTREVAAPVRPQPNMTDFEKRHAERFKGDAFDWYPFRQDGQRFPVADRRLRASSEIFLEPAGGGEARQLTRLGLQPGNVNWTPDGSAIVFTANEGLKTELDYGSSNLYRVSLDGQLTRLTDDGYNYSGVRFSPDGRWMAYTRSYGTDMIIDLRLNHGGSQDLFLQPAAGGEPVNLTEEWDLDPGSPQWSPDSRYIYFTTGIGGATHLFRLPAAGGPVEQVTSGERRLNGIDIDRAFRRMTYTVGEFDRPSDVWVADIDGRNERRLTDVHRDFLAEVQLATHPSERVLWKSYDGTPVEGFLIFPHGYDAQAGPYPLIVMNHGGPHSASGYGFSFKNSLFAANGYFVFLPNFRSSTGYGDAFKWGTWGAWGNNDGEDVLSGVDHLIARYPVDGNRVGTTGHSYGGIMTNWLITRYPDRFKAAIPGAGESNWTSNFALSDIARTKETEFMGPPWDPRSRDIMIKQSAYLNSGGVKAATLFIHGEVDYRVPLEGAIQLYTSLKKQGVPAKMIIYEGMSHGISGHWNSVHRMINELGWWETHLKPSGEVRASTGG